MKHTVNPKIFANITLVMAAAVLSACANGSASNGGNPYESPCPCTGQMYVERVEVNEVIVPASGKKAIARSTPAAEPRAVPVKPKKTTPCVKNDWVEKGWVKDVQPTDVKRKPVPPVEEAAPAPKAKPVVEEVVKPVPVVTEPAPVVAEPAPVVTEEIVTQTTVVTEKTTEQTEAEKARLKSEMEALKAEQERLAQEKEKVVKQIEESKKCDEIKDWVATEGSTLRGLLTEWGDEAGWRVVWNMDRDYTLEAGAVFRGRFMDVSAALLRPSL